MNSKRSLHKLGRPADQRLALTRNLLTSLVTYEYIRTTNAKAKMLASTFDKVVNAAKDKSRMNAERKLKNMLTTELAVKKAIEVLAPRLAEEKSGYLKIYKLNNRPGDNAPMAQVIVKGYQYKEIGTEVKKAASKKPAKKAKKAEAKKEK